MNTKALRVGIAVGLIAFVSIQFQNCVQQPETQEISTAPQIKSALSGNGGGYSGVVETYSKRSEISSCVDGESESEIALTNEGQAFLTREHCQSIAAVEILASDMSLMKHNLSNLIFANSLFDLKSKADGRTQILCRGNSVDESKGLRRVVDAMVRQSNGRYYGRVIVGFYDQNNVITKTLDLGEVALAQPDVNMVGLQVFRSRSRLTNEVFVLQVRLADRAGFLTYVENLPALGSAPTEDHQVTKNEMRGLRCYNQESL